MYIISACLLGDNVKYNGGNNDNEAVRKLAQEHSYFPVCPEVLAGFSVPRPPVEIVGGRAMRQNGEDLTDGFEEGARLVYEQAVEEAARLGETIELAILKAKSPSCGAGRIYDGTFSGKVVPGDGFLGAYLKAQGIKVITEEDMK